MDPLATLLRNVVAPFRETIGKDPIPPAAPKADPLHAFLSSLAEKSKQNTDSLMAKSPFLSKLGADTQKYAGALWGAADEALAKNAENVKLFAKGKLPVSAGDVGSGIMSTIEGVGRLAQGFNSGLVRILKSGAQAVLSPSGMKDLGDDPMLRAFGKSVAGESPIHTYQDIYSKANDYAIQNKATPTGAKVFATSAAFGMLLMDTPLFGGEGQGLKIAAETAAQLAKEQTEKGVIRILAESGVPEDLARKVAPIFKATKSPEEVHAAVAQLNQGAKTAKAITEGADPVERKFITHVKEELPVLGDRVAGQYIPRDTDALAQIARNNIGKDINAAETLARTSTTDEAIATAVQLIKHYTQVAEQAADAGMKNNLLNHAADLTNDVAARLTELGRSVQAASMLGRQTPEGMVRFAARTIQKFNETVEPGKHIPELTGAQIEKITAQVKQAAELPNGAEKAKSFHDVMNEIHDLVPTTIFRKVISVWKAGLLTGLKTSGLNTSSNLFHGISEIVKDVPAVAVDKLASLFTGKRTMALTARGLPSGFSEGTRKGWDYFKTGFDERNVAIKLDMGRVNFGTSPFAKAIQRYEETVFRAMGAEDQPFYYGAKAHSMYSQALAEAKNQGIKKGELPAFVENFVANPTDEVLRNATFDAEMAVFQNETALARAAKGIVDAVPAAEAIIPFRRTPAAVAMQVVNYSPVGLVSNIVKQIYKGQFSQRSLSQAAGRAITGTAALYLGGVLFDHGLITLGRPSTERGQNAQQIQGTQPNSIRVGSDWRQAAVLGPIGISLLVGGYFREGLKNTGSVWGGLAEAAGGAGKSLTEQTFLSGVNQFIDALNDPAHYASGLFKGLIGSIVPTIVSDVARGTDTYERKQDGLLDAAKSRIPGVRETLQPKVDALGNDVKTPDFLTVMLDPSRPTKMSNNPTVLELKRLDDEGLGVTPTQLGTKNGYSSLTPVENRMLWEQTGKLIYGKLTGLFSMDQYKALDDEKKAKVINDVVDKANTLARVNMVLHKTQGLTGDALMKMLGKMKKSGLMNKTVFDAYVQNR